MAILDDRHNYSNSPSQEPTIHQLWDLVLELSEQLTQNRNASVALYGQASAIKGQAVHSKTGFVLRRFNLDIPKDQYEAELERMNEAISAENQALLHDNKHLGSLIKEYEQTLDNLMSTFRKRAREVQDRELSLVREYETKLLAREEENATGELASNTEFSETLGRLSHILRQLIRAQNGEEPLDSPTNTFPSSESVGALSISQSQQREASEYPEPPFLNVGDMEDYALERECELARLEKENEELRRLIGLLPAKPRNKSNGQAFDKVGSGRIANQLLRVGMSSNNSYGVGVKRPSSG